MTRVGIVGIGFMGMVHFLTYKKLPGVRVSAICDRSPEKLSGDWTSIRGNFGPPGKQMNLADLAIYQSVDELIADPQINLVDITLPPFLHAEVSIKALEAGKHVLCEKPMALNVNDCDRMITAAEKSGRKLLIGHVLPFFPEFAWALREIRSGEHGRLLGGSFTRVISDPTWLSNYWNANQVGGPMLDLHIHDAHFIRLLCGMPSTVTTRGSQRNGLPEHWHTLFEFEGGQVTVQATSGVIRQQGRPFLHGFEIHLERATLLFEFAVCSDQSSYLCPPTVLNSAGHVQCVELGDGDPMNAFHAELEHVVRVLINHASLDALDPLLARDALALCEQQARSLTTARQGL